MRLLPMIALLAAVAAGPAAAEPLDRLFSEPHLEGLAEGSSIFYSHTRRTRIEGLDPGPAVEAIRLERPAGAANVLVTLDADGAPRPLPPFRGMSGNPVLMVLLESTVTMVSEATGGSPFYLRNRIKEAFRERLTEAAVTAELGGADVIASEITLRPFEGDDHAGDLGAFAGLEFTFVLSDDAPGEFLSLTAAVPGDGEGNELYFEEIRLDEAR